MAALDRIKPWSETAAWRCRRAIQWIFPGMQNRSLYDDGMSEPGASEGRSAAELITARVAELGDWCGETLARMRSLVKAADPDVVEEWKWRGTPVWSHDGIICTGETYKKVVKLTFARGASLTDPASLFNSSLDGNVRRAIDIPEGAEIDEAAFKALVREAVALNRSTCASCVRATPGRRRG